MHTEDQGARVSEQEYEEQRQQALEDWLNKSPGLVARGFGRSTKPVVQVMKPLVPEKLLQQSFRLADQAGQRLSWRNQVLAQAQCEDMTALQALSLEHKDSLWKSQRRRMMLLAGGEGLLTGLGGAAGWVLDVPALLVLTLEGIHRSALSFGYQAEDEQMALAIMGLAAANTPEEKALAWQMALQSQAEIQHLRKGLEQTFNPAFAKQTAVLSLAQVARQLGLNLGRRKALGIVPLAGAVVGGSVNAWYLRDVMQAARYVFHALHLSD